MRVQEFGLVGEMLIWPYRVLTDYKVAHGPTIFTLFNPVKKNRNNDLALVKQLEDKESKINQLPVSRKENEKKELTPMQVDKKEEKFHKKGREEKEWKTPSPNQRSSKAAKVIKEASEQVKLLRYQVRQTLKQATTVTPPWEREKRKLRNDTYID
ncbi:hypothetical protein GLOIN_2v1766057 [Rhizophagus irregularis DAOM 181602=DAOM 197198]|uniref:Uncharacterized protein n=1 Tax=Rhizophagus irregularis (strain DAOM 181602 / DAOM 197198 / MUCL 43194) TaxID=747089 RepID=A0A2P4QMY3_RHIID|nr:hypothetical protein GLOIN_2v1766057 [Rhizophagus irregularis DAOM 181602=DAOM 197198]POG79017.1 hypothetical protein GLOIN_2v1766057 [Rhizophagus irregularis DAOM 181602=DAOM 197198]CAG8444433.1 10120_t:CDS:2 [Rhizophagus irregularis]|eukprot:XP_025185883.1 hypothetical protein GLOIN_2v1766057 [Rhizophagus irregularis DAOM 181602=DAOM 197198]